MKVTIKDIAQAVGVSPSTVSRVIAKSSKISEETKKKVEKAIIAMDYKPNIMARGLVNKKTRILGVIMPKESLDSFSSPFFIEIMQGMSFKANDREYYLIYEFCKNEEEEFKSVEKLSSSGLIDGICLVRSRKNNKSRELLKEKKVPFVLIGEPDDQNNGLWVDNNNEEVSYKIVEKNRKNNEMVFIGAEEKLMVTINRKKGYIRACEKLGKPQEVYIGRKFSRAEGYKLAETAFKNGKRENFIVTDDKLLIGFLDFLEENKIDDVKIYSFNKIEIKDKWKNKVKFLDIKPKILGEEAIELLIEGIEKGIKNQKKVVSIRV